MTVHARYSEWQRAVDARKSERFGPASTFQVAWLPDPAWPDYPWALTAKPLPPIGTPPPPGPSKRSDELARGSRAASERFAERMGLINNDERRQYA